MGAPVERDVASLQRGHNISNKERKYHVPHPNVLSQVTIDLFAVYGKQHHSYGPLLATGSPMLREDWRRSVLGHWL